MSEEALENCALPNTTYKVNGLRSNPERELFSKIIAGLMRKLEMNEIQLSELNLKPPQGLTITGTFEETGVAAVLKLFEENDDGKKEALD